MSWRTVVISSSAKLDYQMGYLIVRNQDVVKIHISEISILMIETTSVSLTAALLCELTKKKIKVVFCDEKRNPSSELIPYYGSHDTSMKVRKQIAWSEDIKTSVWTEIVTEKIRKQAENLERWDRTEAQMLYEYITQIEFGDATNREGHAAKVYFNALFGLDFTRTAENSINAALNYGYSLLLSTCARETALNGYITQIGLFHDNIFNQFNLASDLMEPFRPIVDNLVKTMHQS
ncbi:type II CRISPR-associated endonuclease Cas1 [Roseburia sp. AF42-8]|uniref:type II CRISPR-associated endonuclease Cas1 n=1 Tax=Roseburia sp. AF42-8 TaxID=2293137 RepID=UPI000E450D2F|nr:type II CRISPR-associated endonuclease Cas1 [Roseburia sp. AF42-8]RGF38721.1 type II CRISPR-associated endonuclease Cas1 [Roseburia sp. AF42-8]